MTTQGAELFDGFPLNGLIDVVRQVVNDDICLSSEIVSEWFAVLRRPILPATKVIIYVNEEVPIPPQVIFEMQGRDRNAPIFTIHKDELEPWKRIQTEINQAAETVAARFIAPQYPIGR